MSISATGGGLASGEAGEGEFRYWDFYRKRMAGVRIIE
jgi:hypothetical protein